MAMLKANLVLFKKKKNLKVIASLSLPSAAYSLREWCVILESLKLWAQL